MAATVSNSVWYFPIFTQRMFFSGVKPFERQCSLVNKLKQNFRKTTKQKNSITKKNHLWKNQY